MLIGHWHAYDVYGLSRTLPWFKCETSLYICIFELSAVWEGCGAVEGKQATARGWVQSGSTS